MCAICGWNNSETTLLCICILVELWYRRSLEEGGEGEGEGRRRKRMGRGRKRGEEGRHREGDMVCTGHMDTWWELAVQWGYIVWLVNHLSPATPSPPLHVDPYKCTSHKLLWLLYDGKVTALCIQCMLSPANSACYHQRTVHAITSEQCMLSPANSALL